MILNTVLISQFFITHLIVLLIISLFAISFYLFYRSRYSISKIERFKAKLRNLIKYNKYYIENNKDNNLFYTPSLMFIFYKLDSSLIIEAHGFGAPYSLQNERLGKLLESALNLSITDIRNTHASHYTFHFDLDKPKRIDAQINNQKVDKYFPIELDSNKEWDFSKIPHCLISGITGAGKTYFVYYLLIEFAKRNADIFLLDPKRADLASLRTSFPNPEKNIATTPNTIAKILREANNSMNDRYEKHFNNANSHIGANYTDYNLDPIVIFIDEVAAVIEEDKKVGKEIESYLKQLIFKGRQAGIFIILITQKPSANVVSTTIRDQVGLRIALGQMSKDGYKMVLGDGL